MTRPVSRFTGICQATDDRKIILRPLSGVGKTLRAVRHMQSTLSAKKNKETPEETAAVAYLFLDATRVSPKSRASQHGRKAALIVEAEGHPRCLVLRQKRSQTESEGVAFAGG